MYGLSAAVSAAAAPVSIAGGAGAADGPGGPDSACGEPPAGVEAGASARRPGLRQILERGRRGSRRRGNRDPQRQQLVGGSRATLLEQSQEGRQQFGVVARPQLAPRAQLRLDLGQHLVVGQEAIDLDEALVDAQGHIGQQPLHQRPPHARIRVQRAGRQPDRVEHVVGRKRIVDVAHSRLAEQCADAQVDRIELALGQPVKELRARRQRRLLFVIEGIEHAQRRQRGIEIGPAPLPTRAGEPPLEQVGQRLAEALDPLAALAAEFGDLGLADKCVAVEQIVGGLDRDVDQRDQPGLELGKAFAQQRLRVLAGQQQIAVDVGCRRRECVGARSAMVV